MMALDSKSIKEEVNDKDTFDNSSRRTKSKESSRSDDSPESVRAVAPRSPISPPHCHQTSLAPPRANHNRSSSPNVNGSITPPLASPASSTTAVTPSALLQQQEASRTLTKVRRFLGALVQFGQDTSGDIGDRVRALILSLASGGLTSDEFKVALQDATNFPLRPYVLPFLKAHIPFLQREISSLARSSNQTPSQYVRTNESHVIEFVHPSEQAEIFLPMDSTNSLLVNGQGERSSTSQSGTHATNGSILKRRASESVYEHQNGAPSHDWNDYMLPAKRHQMLLGMTASSSLYAGHVPLFDYHVGPSVGAHPTEAAAFATLLEKTSSRDERDARSSAGPPDRERSSGRNNTNIQSGTSVASAATAAGGPGGEEEWKNIYTMLNCISAMVEKTKRAITILQQRGNDTHSGYQESALNDFKRQTEEKVNEFRRNAEDSVNQVKRQAMLEIQRAVVSAENRAIESMAQERLKMEKLIADIHKNNASDEPELQSTISPGSQTVCWNCGRKANETCSGCNLARYCGSFCQHKDWEQHHQICGNSRIESNTAKHPPPPPHFRTTVPPTRTSPSSGSNVHHQQSQQQPSQATSATSVASTHSLTNGIASAGSLK